MVCTTIRAKAVPREATSRPKAACDCASIGQQRAGYLGALVRMTTATAHVNRLSMDGTTAKEDGVMRHSTLRIMFRNSTTGRPGHLNRNVPPRPTSHSRYIKARAPRMSSRQVSSLYPNESFRPSVDRERTPRHLSARPQLVAPSFRPHPRA